MTVFFTKVNINEAEGVLKKQLFSFYLLKNVETTKLRKKQILTVIKKLIKFTLV